MDKKKLLEKFLDNECDSREVEIVSQILQEEPNLLDELLPESEWHTHLLKYDQATANKAPAWGKILVAFIIIGICCLGYIGRDTFRDARIIASSGDSFFTNNTDTVARFTLPDSSEVLLAPQSSFYASISSQYPIRYIKLLSGELNIKVHKDPFRPFVAQSGETHVTALGTEFTLKHDAHQNYSYVALHEGKLKVKLNNASLKKMILLPGDRVVYAGTKLEVAKDDALIANTTVDNRFTSETIYARPTSILIDKNAIRMHQTQLSEALNFISHELDMPIGYSPTDVEKYHISGVFIIPDEKMDMVTKEAIATEILNIITSVNPFVIQQKHNTYILTNND